MESVSKKPRQSSVTQKQSSQKTKTIPKKVDKLSSDIPPKVDKLSSDIPPKVDNSSSSSLKMKKMKTLGSSQHENSTRQTKNPWDGYDFDKLPPISLGQAKTFRKVTRQETLRMSKGRPRKLQEEKFQSITLRIEPSLLLKIKDEAEKIGYPWQSYLKIMREKGMKA